LFSVIARVARGVPHGDLLSQIHLDCRATVRIVPTMACLTWTVEPERGSAKERGRGTSMPRYEFMCQKCKRAFELIMTIAEREKAKARCPNCKSTKVLPLLGPVMVQTSKKS
jgi:putative FmdB family regulatory protein